MWISDVRSGKMGCEDELVGRSEMVYSPFCEGLRMKVLFARYASHSTALVEMDLVAGKRTMLMGMIQV